MQFKHVNWNLERCQNVILHSENIISEKKLKKVAGQSNKEPTSKDIIKSLEQCKEASMRRLLDSSNGTSQPQDYSEAVVNKTHQGQQQDVEEIVAIVYQDQLAAHSTEHSAQHTVTEHTEQDPSLQQRWNTCNKNILTKINLSGCNNTWWNFMSMCAKVSDVNLNDRHTSNAVILVLHILSQSHLYMYLHSWKGGMSKLSKYILKKKWLDQAWNLGAQQF